MTWHALQAGIEGQVLLPGSPGYERARRPAMDRFAATRPLAVAPPRPSGGTRGGGDCFAHRSALFLLKHAVAGPPAARHWLDRSWGTSRPWGSGGVYPNFPEPDLTSWAEAYHGENYPRLRRVKARYDPDGFFRFPQAIQTGLP